MEILRGTDPVELFKEWLEAAEKAEPNNHEAMALATVGADGRPSVRMVLLKGVDAGGFSFYTNMESRKGRELATNPKAALCFYWKALSRQVRVEGAVELVPAPIVDAYFKTRHALSRLSAWASKQSEALQSRDELEARVKEFGEKFEGGDIPRPPHWSGYKVVPYKIEFWQQGEGRLHDRFLFTKTEDGWDLTRLNP